MATRREHLVAHAAVTRGDPPALRTLCCLRPQAVKGIDVAALRTSIALAGIFMAAGCFAQRASENAVTSASDAFGNSIGAESIGLYSAAEVRGFSPILAGNLRLDGLYFDQLDSLNPRLFERRVVRVGPSAQGYAFPGPTGIVDNYLREPGTQAVRSILVEGNSFDGGGIELDAELPLSATFGLAGGASLSRSPDYPGGDHVDVATVGTVADWRWQERYRLQVFGGRMLYWNDRTTPFIFAAGAQLPPVLSREYLGQTWARWHTELDNFGMTGSAQLGGWQLRAGVFRHVISIDRGFDVLFLDTDQNGVGRLVVNADPSQQWTYNSGELRLSRAIESGQWRHSVHVSARGGERGRSYGGTDTEDFGEFSIGRRPRVAEPDFEFGPQSRDRASQWAAGVAYRGQWAGRGELGFGVQKLRYRKSAMTPAVAAIHTKAEPLLWNATTAVDITDALVAYAGYTRGLEESKVAPANAVNRNEAPPALLTSQRDVGAVLRLHPDLRFILGAFEVQKPYFNVDAAQVFRRLGTVTHRGVEFSVNGTPVRGLSVVAGAVLLRPRIEGEAVDQGLIGTRPVGQPQRVIKLNLDYRPPAMQQFSVDLALASGGSRAVSADNRLAEPGHTTMDVGARYRFRIDAAPATLRLVIANVGNENGWNVSDSGGLRPLAPRRASLTLTIDF